MNRFRKEDSEDPTHKWIGTYNSNLIHVVKFFKWLHYPNIEPTKRLKPEVVQNFPKLRRLEISDYEPPKMQQDATGFKSYDKRVGEVLEKVGDHFKWQHKNEEMRQEIYDTLVAWLERTLFCDIAPAFNGGGAGKGRRVPRTAKKRSS